MIINFVDSFKYIAIAVVILYAILLYILAKVLPGNKWEAIFQTEIIQLFYSIALILSLGILVTLFDGLMTMANGMKLHDLISLQLSNMVKHTSDFIGEMIIIFQFLDMYNKVSFVNIGYPKLGEATVKIYPGIELLIRAVLTVRDVLTVSLASLMYQSILFDFIKNLALEVVLPIGIILRILPIFRTIGNELIGVSIAFYVLFPIMYLVFYNTLNDLIIERGGLYNRNAAFLSTYAEYYTSPNIVMESNPVDPIELNNLETSLRDSVDQVYRDVINNMQGIDYGDYIQDLLTGPLNTFGYTKYLPLGTLAIMTKFIEAAAYIVVSIGVPAFSIAITFSAAKSIRDFLEGLV